MAKRKKWSYSAGKHGYIVRVFERNLGGPLWMARHDPAMKREVKWSLRHFDRKRAEEQAEELSLALRKNAEIIETPTPGLVFPLYRENKTPDKGRSARQEDDRQLEMWLRFLRPDFDLTRLSVVEWDRFKRHRRTGAVDGRGNPVPPDERRTVGDRVVGKDLGFLRTVCRWAVEARLMDRDPTFGLKIQKEKNPKRPVATIDRVESVRSKYREPWMRVEWDGFRERIESYLPHLFEIAVGTGRRITAICSLTVSDLDLTPRVNAPHGSITWSADHDKIGAEWKSIPIDERVRGAIEEALEKRKLAGQGIGLAWLFPRPGDPSKPVRYEEASQWLRKAETLAGLETQDGSLWHAYRRMWATARKHLSIKDVMEAGGWQSVEALQQSYQHADAETLLHVVLNPAEVRAVR
jgi:integrase